MFARSISLRQLSEATDASMWDEKTHLVGNSDERGKHLVTQFAGKMDGQV